MTALDIKKLLVQAGFGPDCYLVEWSTSRCDYCHLAGLLDIIGGTSILPPRHNSIHTVVDWRRVLPGFKSFILGFFFTLIFPTRKDLLMKAHTARADTEMLFFLTGEFMKYLLT